MIVRTVITDSPDTRPEDPCLQDRCERHNTMMRYIGTYLRGIITSLSEDTICIRSRELFLFNFSQFLQIAVISCFGITVKIDHNDDSQMS